MSRRNGSDVIITIIQAIPGTRALVIDVQDKNLTDKNDRKQTKGKAERSSLFLGGVADPAGFRLGRSMSQKESFKRESSAAGATRKQPWEAAADPPPVGYQKVLPHHPHLMLGAC